MDLDGLIEEAKKQLALVMLDGKLDTCEIVRVGILLAEKMTVIENLSGKDKKKFVLHAVDVAVKAAVPASQYEAEVSNFVKNILPSMLDMAFDVARGRFSLVKPSASCFAGVFAALGCSAQMKAVFDPVRKAVPVVDKVLDEVVKVVPALAAPVAVAEAVLAEAVSVADALDVPAVPAVPDVPAVSAVPVAVDASGVAVLDVSGVPQEAE
jgi:hypothetical protein